MFWGKPGKEISLTPQTINPAIYGLGTNQAYAVYPTWVEAPGAGAGISLGTNAIQVFEHSANYLPSVLSHVRTISSSQFTHIALVYEINNANEGPKLYVNGRYVAIGMASGRTVYPSTAFFGGPPTDFKSWTPFKGQMDEIQVYNRPLSASEIQNVYNSGTHGLCKSTSASAAQSCTSDTKSRVELAQIDAQIDAAIKGVQEMRGGIVRTTRTEELRAAIRDLQNLLASTGGVYSADAIRSAISSLQTILSKNVGIYSNAEIDPAVRDLQNILGTKGAASQGSVASVDGLSANCVVPLGCISVGKQEICCSPSDAAVGRC